MLSSLLDKSVVKVTPAQRIVFPLALCLPTQETSRRELLVIKEKETPAHGGRVLQVKKERQSRVASTLGRAENDVLPWDSHGQALIQSHLLCWSGSNLEPLGLHLIESPILHLGFKNCQKHKKASFCLPICWNC